MNDDRGTSEVSLAARVMIAGFSQGGILNASVALTAPDRVGRFAILSGRIRPELKLHVASREKLAHLRRFIARGDYDGTLPVMWSQRSYQWLNELGVANVNRLYAIGHEISTEMQTEFMEWHKQ